MANVVIGWPKNLHRRLVWTKNPDLVSEIFRKISENFRIARRPDPVRVFASDWKFSIFAPWAISWPHGKLDVLVVWEIPGAPKPGPSRRERGPCFWKNLSRFFPPVQKKLQVLPLNYLQKIFAPPASLESWYPSTHLLPRSALPSLIEIPQRRSHFFRQIRIWAQSGPVSYGPFVFLSI